MVNILVTGGAGFIGSHAAKALRRAGYTPVTYDNFSTGNGWAVRWGPLETGDVLDPRRLDDVFRRYAPAGVLHFAALSLVGESFNEAERYCEVNVVGTRNVADACIRHGNVPIVFSSSCAVYGVPDRLPLVETAPKRPISPYGTTKLGAEKRLEVAFVEHGLRSISLRYFNAAGADPDCEIGESRRRETHLVPLAFEALLGGRGPLKLFGTDYPTRDGTAVRDYIHVTDLAEVHVKALRALLGGASAGAFNLGTGRGVTVREVLESVAEVAGLPVPIAAAPRRDGDPAELYADCAAACSSFGPVTTDLSSLRSIVGTAWAWHTRMQMREAA